MSGEQPARARPTTAAPRDSGRRRAASLLALAGLAAVLPERPAAAAAPADPAKLPPQPGDGFVHADGDKKGQPVAPADLPLDGPLAVAWPSDPASGTVRSGSKLNWVLLLRLDPASLDAKTRARAAEGGIVAYSGFCTHAGCLIELYEPDDRVIYCHCHSSQFDPRAGAKVVLGPARRSLAGLPVRLDGDRLVIAGGFVGKPGVPKEA